MHILFALSIKFGLVISLLPIGEVIANVPGEAWVRRARIVDGQSYFINVMQKFCYELERREWSNLKLTDINKTINTTIANWHIIGTVKYTNGFVVSIQKIDLSSFSAWMTGMIEDNILKPRASIRGRLNFRDINIGYDVIANLTDLGIQRYTGEILNNHIAFDFLIIKDLSNETITVSCSFAGVEGRFTTMIYSPANHVTEVLSRNFVASDNWSGASSWRHNFLTIVMNIVHNKVEFPRICFNDC